MKNKLKKFGGLRLLSMGLLLFLIFTGSECNELINQVNVPGNLVGNWKLTLQTGALQDICPEENANFQSGGIAVLTCPNSQSVSRSYNVNNNVLTYTETSVAYDVVFSNNNQTLELKGKNVSRNLTYTKQSGDAPQVSAGSEVSTTSSDLPKEVQR